MAAHDGGPDGRLRFGCTAKELKELMETRGVDAVNRLKHKYGTVDELCRRLIVSPNEGKPTGWSKNWHHWSVCVVQQRGGHIEHLMQKLQDVTVSFDVISMSFPVVNFFLKCVVTEVLFSIVALKTLTFHKVV